MGGENSSNRPLSITTKRKLEFLSFLLLSLLIIVVTVSYLTLERVSSSIDLKSCTEHSKEPVIEIKGTRVVDSFHATGMVYPPGTYWTSANGTSFGCPCLVKTCILKCCRKEECNKRNPFENPPYCRHREDSLDLKYLEVHQDHGSTPKELRFILIDGDKCDTTGNIYLGTEGDNSFLLNDGRLLRNGSIKEFWKPSEFCLRWDYSCKIHYKFCPRDSPPHWVFVVHGVGMLISLPFLISTVVVYASLPSLQNLQGKALICHVTSLTVAYSGSALVQLATASLSRVPCILVAFMIQFSMLTSFFWLNIMCFDLWWVFSGLRPLRISQRVSDSAKFQLYSLYAWGCPLLILALSLIIEFAPGVPDTAIRPEMGVKKCFFKEKDATLLYLYLPVGVLLFMNTAMFVATTLRFHDHYRSTQMLDSRDSRRYGAGAKSTGDIQRFSLYLKLSVVMGVNWVLEVMSFLIGGHFSIWLVTDVANAFQGVYIFYLFVCKRRIFRMLHQRINPAVLLTSTKTSSAASARHGKLEVQRTLEIKESLGV